MSDDTPVRGLAMRYNVLIRGARLLRGGRPTATPAVAQRGCFTDAVEASRGRRVPLKWEHRREIGTVTAVADTADGLRFAGRVWPHAREALEALEAGHVGASVSAWGLRWQDNGSDGLSIVGAVDFREISLAEYPACAGCYAERVSRFHDPARALEYEAIAWRMREIREAVA